MERALRKRGAKSRKGGKGGGVDNSDEDDDAPDVVKSALDHKTTKINSSTIDNIFGAPQKIDIPERYIPETVCDHCLKTVTKQS